MLVESYGRAYGRSLAARPVNRDEDKQNQSSRVNVAA